MPVNITYTDNPFGVIGQFSGDITGDDIIAFNNKIADCKECIYQLTDFREAISIEVSLEELHKIAIQDCSIPEDYRVIKIAMVGDTEKYREELKTYYLFIDAWIGKQRGFESKAFSSMKEARHWLGLNPE